MCDIRLVDYLPEGLDALPDCLIAQVSLASRPVRLSDGLEGRPHIHIQHIGPLGDVYCSQVRRRVLEVQSERDESVPMREFFVRAKNVRVR